MIVVGYQGIGKSSISMDGSGFIDLESGNFWVDGKRDEQWYIPYCAIANHLSEQGYCVFVSSHEVVRKQLRDSKQHKVIVCPAEILREKWIQKLRDRYEQTRLDKDYKAYANAKARYLENIQELLSEKGFEILPIFRMDYDLGKMLNAANEKEKTNE